MTPPAFRLLLAQSLDAATFAAFYVLIGAGVHAERNPLLIGLMAFGGIQAVVLLKVAIAWSSAGATTTRARCPRATSPCAPSP